MPNDLEGLMQAFAFREAIASTALSHPEDHDCDICKAAAGDEDATMRVLMSVLREGR